MATNKLQRLRRQAFIQQHGYCFYCSNPIWEKDEQTFAHTHGIAVKSCRHLRCTGEHLLARKDGGKIVSTNIVAACLWCNRQRHRGRHNNAPEPAAYKQWVRMQVARNRWHPVVTSRAAAYNRRTLLLAPSA